MSISTEKTVREYALELPNATRVFDKLKIDYCCGGARSVGAACDAAGVPLGELARLLAEAGTAYMPENVAARVQTGTLAELIDYIIDKHHVFTRDEMERINALLDKVCFKHGESHPEAVHARALFRRLCDDLKPHMVREEAVLFPYVKALEEAARRGTAMPFAPFGTVNNPVRMMMLEHDTAGDILRELRAATADYAVPPDACLSFHTLYAALENFEQDLHQHIHLENNVLFPRAVELENGKR